MFTMEVEGLIERCRQGDAEALETLYTTYARRMRSVCRRYVSDEQVVSDILHDSFVIIFTSFDKLNDDSKAEGWMMAITRNVALKYVDYRESHRTVKLDDTGEAELADEDNQDNDVRGIPFSEVMKLVERLPEGYGQVFRLSVFEGLSHKEIAGILGIEPHSSSSQLTRAKKMLRMMIQQYGIILLLMLIPLLLYLLWKGESSISKEEKPVVAKQKEKPEPLGHRAVDDGGALQPKNPIMANSSVRQDIADAIDTMQLAMAHTVDSTCVDSLVNMIAHEQIVSDTVIADTAYAGSKCSYVANLRPAKSEKHSDWHISLAYIGDPHNEVSRTDNYMTMPSFSGITSRSTKIYNWGEYMDYVLENEQKMDPISASNMMQMAIINSNYPSEPLAETKHHERPFTIRMSLSRQIFSKWSLETGLSYIRMKSTFESGNENTSIHRTQRLHYLGIPLKFGYVIAGSNRWSLYANGGVQVDIPFKARLSTRYIYSDVYEHIGNSPDIDTSIRAPWQWSVEAGVGLQYRIGSRLNLYLEPGINYYLPVSSGIENYITEHPFMFSLPVGVRFTW